jgi:hypothetical protein
MCRTCASLGIEFSRSCGGSFIDRCAYRPLVSYSSSLRKMLNLRMGRKDTVVAVVAVATIATYLGRGNRISEDMNSPDKMTLT